MQRLRKHEMMGNFTLRDEKYNVKDFLLNFVVGDMILFVAVEQGSEK